MPSLPFLLRFALGIIGLFIFVGCSFTTSTKNIQDKQILHSNPAPVFDILQTNIAKPYKQILKNKPHLTGALLVSDGQDALLHRAYLTRMAQKSIILQTYIYKNDLTSRMLMHEIWLAAQRGVIVKMLIDDNGLDSDFSDIIALDSHPNIEVKIFNPYKNRSRILRAPEMMFDFNRINHRMHNKLFIVDDIALIIGGRNIADHYFDNNQQVNFVDTDVFFLGNVAQKAKENFYEYWNFHRSIPASLLPIKTTQAQFKQSIKNLKADPQWSAYDNVINSLIDKYQNKIFEILWGNAILIADKPEKIQNPNIHKPIPHALGEIFNFTLDNIYISAAYFVPGKQGVKYFKKLIDSGVSISILTNSLASTDSLVVYSAWERYRSKLLQAGVRIYEYRHSGNGKAKLREKSSKSKASLHSKSIVFDDHITWIGSFNLDQRSSNLNTEAVVIFDNPTFAKILKQDLIEDMSNAWRLYEKNGKTYWEETQGEMQSLNFQPDTNLWLRILNVLSKIFPEDQI